MDGHIQLRRGLIEHLRAGRLNLFQLGVYAHLLFCADFRTGIHLNSAVHVFYSTGQQFSIRHIQRALEALEKAGYIKRFMVKGRKGDYYILIHKYEVTAGALIGKRLNAIDSTDYANPIYFSGADEGADEDADRGVDKGGDRGDDDGDFVKKSVNKYGKKFREKSEKKSVEGESLPAPSDPDILEYLNGDINFSLEEINE